jgi:hypothetical protein
VGEVLVHVLRHHRHDKDLRAALTLPWRPLFNMLQQLYEDPLPNMQGKNCSAKMVNM